MKVLALASYPTEAAATRYRLEQFVIPLAERGITLTIHPFLNSKHFEKLYRREALPSTALGLIRATLRRSAEVLSARQSDVVLVQLVSKIYCPLFIVVLSA